MIGRAHKTSLIHRQKRLGEQEHYDASLKKESGSGWVLCRGKHLYLKKNTQHGQTI